MYMLDDTKPSGLTVTSPWEWNEINLLCLNCTIYRECSLSCTAPHPAFLSKGTSWFVQRKEPMSTFTLHLY